MRSYYLAKIRAKNPLIHNITNIVAANYCANGLLALGASPIMAVAIEEMEDVPAISQALVINIGTLVGKEIEAMLLAGKTANQLGIPVILDPVGVAATQYRKQTVAQLLAHIQFSGIRGNAGEFAYLAGADWQAKGVDAGKGDANLNAICQQVARKYQTIAMMSGEVDVISDGNRIATLHNGSPMFPKVTGSGCLLSAISGAFFAVADKSDYFNAAVECCSTYAIAGELVAKSLKATQYGQFYTGLLDKLAEISAQEVEQNGRVNYV
ncbi:hydroxyethylthiazole kinase [Ursidibacter arcticus]|uniref:hydroxyethylthiazole kinase n=1 Tax=Ursidibacter arcticus TaxID=1524965 RepID=UPI0012FBA5BF|nr:hydroxyethylthiazole kinase [Ursidibacter arcticus]KAE9537788.1 hydroxyethylthiazole kinase [Ursidibacter arcticus]